MMLHLSMGGLLSLGTIGLGCLVRARRGAVLASLCIVACCLGQRSRQTPHLSMVAVLSLRGWC